jgi:4-amino-4-deoxy-L-arabinose transferase-like glycosyltransferase
LPPKLSLAAALVAYVVLAIGYIVLTPPWENPDEPAHYNYVAFVAQTGGLPVLQPGDWDSALLERVKNGTANDISSIRYESWQPPLYYLLAAPFFRVAPSLYTLRALNAVLGGITLLVAYAAARYLFATVLAELVPLAMVGVPMFTSVSAAASADPLTNLFAAVLLLALLTRLRRDVSPFLLGALLGLGLLTKLELAIFGPLIVGVIFLRSKQPLRESVFAFATAGVLLLPWLIHQVTSYGWTDPLALARHSQVVADQQRFPGFSLDWLGQFLGISFHSFWAQFGWMAVVAPPRLYLAWGILTAAALVGLVLNRQWWAALDWRLVVTTVALAFVGYVGYNMAFEQFQSRYLFTALVPIVALLVRGWSALPRRSWPALVLAVALVALNAYALTRVLVPGFAPPG